MISKEHFFDFLNGALESSSEDRFVAEYGTSPLLYVGKKRVARVDEDQNEQLYYEHADSTDNLDADAIAAYLHDVWVVSRLTIREIREHTGLSRAAFGRRFGIGIRTLENWEAESGVNARTCPRYVVMLLAQVTGMADILPPPKSNPTAYRYTWPAHKVNG